MDKKLEKALNEQIQKELYSSYLYLAMVAYFEDKNLPGFANWMIAQSSEERMHAMKIFSYLSDRGSRVVLEAIEQPPVDYKSVEDVFKLTLEHEQIVTESINNLYELSKEVNDNASEIFLQWFVTEQVEEEKSVQDILAKLDFIKDNPMGIIMLDRELAARPRA